MGRGRPRGGGAYVALNEAKPSTALAILQRLTAEACAEDRYLWDAQSAQ